MLNAEYRILNLEQILNLKQIIYRTVFWAGYVAVLVTTFIPIKGVTFDKIKIGPEAFRIRLDHFLHFTVYLLICMYYFAGQKQGLSLFTVDPLRRFLLLILFLAIVTELIQLWVPERVFNVFDMLSNVVGVIVGVGVIRVAQGARLRAQSISEKKGH